MITFNSFILYGLWLRFSTVFIGAIFIIFHIGEANIQFLFKYIERSFFSIKKLIYWFISFLSIIYFEHLIANAKYITFTKTYNNQPFLTILVSILLIGVILYAIYDSLQNFIEAERIKPEVEDVRRIKRRIDYIPLIGKTISEYLIKDKVKTKVSDSVRDTIESMLRIVFLNLTIVIVSVYLITGQIIFF